MEKPNFKKEHWSVNEFSELNAYLKSIMDPDYLTFSKKLVNTENTIIGVRLPILQKIAKEIAKGNYREFLLGITYTTHEECLVHGLVIGNLTLADNTVDDIFTYIEAYLPKIDNWSSCDTFCSKLKITKSIRKTMFEYIKKQLYSEKAFSIRFGIVMLLDYYVQDDYVDKALFLLDTTKFNHYYVKMAIAWAYSIFFISYEEKVMLYLRKKRDYLLLVQERMNDLSLDRIDIKDFEFEKFIYLKTLSKIIESYRVNYEKKNEIRELRI